MSKLPANPALRLGLWASLALGWCLPALRHLRDDAWDYDEGPLLQAAALARDGARLYAEVSLNKPPVLTWILRAGFALGRPDVASARLAVLAVTLGGFVALGRLADALFGAPAGLATLALMLCAGDLLPRAAVVMPDLPGLALATVSLLCAVRYRVDRRDRWWFASALAYAAAVATHPLVGGVALPITALVLARRDPPVARSVKALALYAALVVALVALCLLPYDRAGLLHWTVRYNLAIRLTRHELAEPAPALIARYLREHRAVVALALGSGAWLWRDPRARLGVAVAALWSVATLIELSLWQPLWDNYYAWTLVPLVLLAGAGLGRVVAQRVLGAGLPLGGRVAAAVAVLGLLAALTPRSLPWRGRSAETAAVVHDLQAVTPGGGYVASDDPFAVFAAGFRAPPPLADTSHKSIVTGFLGSAEALAALRRHRVRVVLMGTGRFERMDAFTRAVRLAAVDRRMIGGHERLVIDPARLR